RRGRCPPGWGPPGPVRAAAEEAAVEPLRLADQAPGRDETPNGENPYPEVSAIRVSVRRALPYSAWVRRSIPRRSHRSAQRLVWHTLPLVLSGQPFVLAFFRPVVCEPVMLFSALRRMASERARSVTTRETVSAPIRVNAATIARLLASSGVPSSNPPARASTSFKNPAVAAARV